MCNNNNTKIEIKPSPIHGLGVFAKEEIKKDEVILTWHPKLLTSKEVSELTEHEKQSYLYIENGNTYLQQEPERYVNHSCSPNSYVDHQCDIALRDIRPGEEITSDYLSQGDGAAPDKFVCHCNSSNCRHQSLRR